MNLNAVLDAVGVLLQIVVATRCPLRHQLVLRLDTLGNRMYRFICRKCLYEGRSQIKILLLYTIFISSTTKKVLFLRDLPQFIQPNTFQ